MRDALNEATTAAETIRGRAEILEAVFRSARVEVAGRELRAEAVLELVHSIAEEARSITTHVTRVIDAGADE